MASRSAFRALLVLIALPLLIAVAPGASAVIGPGAIADQGSIYLNLSNVTNGTVLNTTVTAVFAPAPGVTWLNLTNWNYPFALQAGRLGVSGQNVNRLTLFVRTGGASLTGVRTGAGNISVEIPADIQPFTFYDFRIGYEIHNPNAPLAFTLYQRGTKAGPVTEGNLTPSVIGVGEGNLTVSVLANGTSVGSRVIPVLKAVPVTAPAPVNATTPPPENTTTTAPETPSSPQSTTAPSAPPTPAMATPSTSPLPTATIPAVTATPPAVPAAAPAEATGPSPFIIGFAAIIVIGAAIADYLLLKD
jgi:hypothetical protein